jgi:ATP-dependent DNA helicase RecG
MNNKANNLTSTKTSKFNPQTTKDTPVQYVKGVGPARARMLERLGIKTINDLLFCFPWRYEDRKNLKKICNLNYGSHETTVGEVVTAEVITTPRKRMKIFELSVTDETGVLVSKWCLSIKRQRVFHRNRSVHLCLIR